jgi:ribonuclease R
MPSFTPYAGLKGLSVFRSKECNVTSRWLYDRLRMVKSKKIKDPFAEREAQKYENPIPSREFILQYLDERGKPATQEDIESDLQIEAPDQVEALRRRLIAMTRDGQLLKNRKGAFGPLASMELIAGRIIGHKDGFGFIEPDDGQDDLFISPRQMRAVFHGDRVLARVSNVDSRGRREAIIVEVLEHNTQQVVGRLRLEAGTAYAEPSNLRVNQDILIPLDELQGATNGQMVVVGITSFPSIHHRPTGKIVEVLGDHMAPGMEISVAIRNHDLPNTWPDDVQLEAARFPAEVAEEDIKGREDFRQMPFVTIDGEDAKDFDDAVYCEPRDKGGWTLYVAIADVSHYVKPNSPLDREAYQRGNSVYFPGRVIPMLPEVLSNNLCSLNANVNRLAMVCEMSIHPSGRITRYRFYEGVIKSHARLTYTQVHAMMEKKDRRMREQKKEFVPHLTHLYDLFKVLHDARQKRGAIDFDLPETKIVFGKDRKIEKIVPYERFNSHRVIEECMLSANICAARFLEKNEQPALYRVHQGPTQEKLNDLRRFLQEMGLKMPTNREPLPADYATILRAVADRPDANMIQTVLLRSMSQAVYQPENKGHFGLAYDAYTHFTSPIRRYPDLLVHRAIRHLLRHKSAAGDLVQLGRAGEHCSMTERRADDATREVSDWLKCEYMMDKVGQEFDGIISGVTNFGVFVELREVYVEGLVHISSLPDDYYQFDPIKHTLHSDRSGKRYRLGDAIRIQVARVDLDQRKIDFALPGAELLARKSTRQEKGSRGSRRRKAKKQKEGARPEKKATDIKASGKKKRRRR